MAFTFEVFGQFHGAQFSTKRKLRNSPTRIAFFLEFRDY